MWCSFWLPFFVEESLGWLKPSSSPVYMCVSLSVGRPAGRSVLAWPYVRSIGRVDDDEEGSCNILLLSQYTLGNNNNMNSHDLMQTDTHAHQAVKKKGSAIVPYRWTRTTTTTNRVSVSAQYPTLYKNLIVSVLVCTRVVVLSIVNIVVVIIVSHLVVVVIALRMVSCYGSVVVVVSLCMVKCAPSHTINYNKKYTPTNHTHQILLCYQKGERTTHNTNKHNTSVEFIHP